MKNLTDFNTQTAIEVPQDFFLSQLGIDRSLLEAACVIYQGRFWITYRYFHSIISDGLSDSSTLALLRIAFEDKGKEGKNQAIQDQFYLRLQNSLLSGLNQDE